MRPVLVDPPTVPVVTLQEMKEHLRVDPNVTDQDDMISALGAAATAHLDGWTGVLCRCIMPQKWALDLPAGRHVLPFPDVMEATFDPDGEPLEVQIESTQAGPVVSLERGGVLHFTCAMPEQLLPAAQVAVKAWVSEAYDEREAGQSIVFRMLVTSLRWWRT